MNKAYARYVIGDFFPKVLFVSLFGMLIAFALPYTFGTFEMAKVMRGMLETLPPAMRAMMGNDIEGFLSIEGSVGFALKHPILLSMMIYMAIVLPTKYMGKAIEHGKMELLLTIPIKRSGIFWTFVQVSLFFFIMAGVMTSLGSILAVKLLDAPDFPYHLLMRDILLYLVFFMSIFSLTTLGMVGLKDPGKGVLWTIIFISFFYLLDILARYKPWLATTDKYNLFKYYETQEIMTGKGHWGLDMMVLGIAATMLILLAWVRFKRRDIP